MKKFPSIPPRLEEDYHSIKDDIMLVSVYTIGNVTVRGLLIPNAVLTKEICATDDNKEYETVFINVVVLINQLQLVVSTQGTHRSAPRAHRTPTLTTASAQGKKRKQSAGETSSLQKSLKVTIKQKQVVEGEKDKESYADKFAASLIHNDDDDSGDRIEPESDKEHPEVIVDDDDNQDEKKDDEMGSLENRTEKMQTPIPTTPRSPRIILSSDKNINQELTKVHRKVDKVLHEIVPQFAERATNDLIEGNLKRVVSNIVIQERDVIQAKQYVHHNVIQVYPTTTTSTDTTSSADLQQILYSKMKRSLQDKANDPALWEEEETVIDEDKVILKDETPKLITESQNVDKRVPTIFDHARMKATLNDMLNNQFRNAEEYAYHLEQATNFIENQIVWESRQEDIR
ncbi:hypothetical protein Tco_0555798 [Tanacetum coccineum]